MTSHRNSRPVKKRKTSHKGSFKDVPPRTTTHRPSSSKSVASSDKSGGSGKQEGSRRRSQHHRQQQQQQLRSGRSSASPRPFTTPATTPTTNQYNKSPSPSPHHASINTGSPKPSRAGKLFKFLAMGKRKSNNKNKIGFIADLESRASKAREKSSKKDGSTNKRKKRSNSTATTNTTATSDKSISAAMLVKAKLQLERSLRSIRSRSRRRRIKHENANLGLYTKKGRHMAGNENVTASSEVSEMDAQQMVTGQSVGADSDQSSSHVEGGRKPSSSASILFPQVRKPKLPCPKKLNAANEVALVRLLLDYRHKYLKPVYRSNNEVPKGLEFLRKTENLYLQLRRVSGKNGICYTTFTQYDLKNEEDDVALAIAIEKTNSFQVFCCLESRSFNMYFYDYLCTRIIMIAKSFSLKECCTRFFCCCCCCGSSGCGNKLTVYDGANQKIGYIKQCLCCARRLAMYAEKKHRRDLDMETIPQKYSCREFLCKSKCMEAQVLKFDAYNFRGELFVRIEQHLAKSNIFKFIYASTLEPVGYMRKESDSRLQLDLWYDFHETEKAVLIAAAVLLDHIMVGISVKGSYGSGGDTEEDDRMRTETGEIVPGNCYKFWCFNRLRIFILVSTFLFLCAVVVSVLLYFLFFTSSLHLVS